MKIFLDCEFTGLRKDTTLISLGAITENEKTFYAEFNDFNVLNVDEWIYKNVIKKLHYENNKECFAVSNDKDTLVYGDAEFIKYKFIAWIKQFDNVEFILDVGHYDFILITELIFGNSMNVTNWFPKTYEDLNQFIANYYNIPVNDAFDVNRIKLSELNDNLSHNSLFDAKVIKKIYDSIT